MAGNELFIKQVIERDIEQDDERLYTEQGN